MASTKVETQLTVSAASSVTVASAAIVWFDAMAFNAEDWDGSIQVSADNAGTPAAGDVCNVYVAYSPGDTLGDTGNDYDSEKHAQWLMQLDTYSTNGEDPARKTASLKTANTGFKIGVACPNAATRNIVVRARMTTHRPQ